MNPKNFIVKSENIGRKKKGKREYLNKRLTRDLIKKLEILFETNVEVPRIKVGNRQTIETLINEEVLLFANYLRQERQSWTSRIVQMPSTKSKEIKTPEDKHLPDHSKEKELERTKSNCKRPDISDKQGGK